jgi:hypothetical protein
MSDRYIITMPSSRNVIELAHATLRHDFFDELNSLLENLLRSVAHVCFSQYLHSKRLLLVSGE